MVWLSEWWHQVSATVSQGLSITALGMALVFFTLGLVIVAMVLLTKLPWLRAKEPGEDPQSEQVEASASPDAPPVSHVSGVQAPVAPVSTPDAAEELADVAAIAVAVLRSRRGTHRRAAQPAGTRSAWKNYGRAHQLGL